MFALLFCYLNAAVAHGLSQARSPAQLPNSRLQELFACTGHLVSLPLSDSLTQTIILNLHIAIVNILIELRRCAVSQSTPSDDFDVLKSYRIGGTCHLTTLIT